MEYDIGFVGLGYVGLSTAVCFSNRRMKVIGIEIDTNKISQIRKAKTPIHEKDMSELLKKAIDKNNLVVFHCVANYPAKIGSQNLLFLNKIKYPVSLFNS